MTVPLSAGGELWLLAVWIPADIILWKLTRAIFSYKCEENSPVVHLPKGSWLGKHPGERGEGMLPYLYPAPESDPTVCLFWDTWSCDQLLSSQIHHLLVLELAAFPILTLMGLLGKWLDIVWAQLLMVDGVFCLETHSDVLRTCVEELWECSAERQSVNT